ncbi:ribosome maturation factor RimM [Actinomyces mediterranea]|uniref:ribosome maturation factor RimM n=1 Tax=Actinomyces mediterranea TaxID=1871028 RepID=UPI000971038C|nr:ribosome maturation factor RimM [Actinomyces mediterranea]
MKMTAGIIGPAHGLRGEVIVDIRSDDPDVWSPGSAIEADTRPPRELTVSRTRVHKDRVFVSFCEVTTREEAEALRGAALLVDAHDEHDAWYPHQLDGCMAVTVSGETLGTVVGLRFGAAQDLLVVSTDRGRVLVPFVYALVPDVDVDAGTVTIDAPPGLFDDSYIDADDRGEEQ